MFNINNRTKKITLTVGDTATIWIKVKDQLNQDYTIQSTDVITLTVRETADSATAVLTKTATADHYFVIEHSDTSSLTAGFYMYDIQYQTSEGEYYTIVPPTPFELTQEVTR